MSEAYGARACSSLAAAPGDPARAGVAPRSLSARERLALLFDEGTAIGRQPHLRRVPERAGWPLLSAVGRVHGMAVCAIVQDAAASASGLDAPHWRQIALAVDYARRRRLPLVAVFDGSATRRAGGLATWDLIARSLAGVVACTRPRIALVCHANTGPAGVLASLFDTVIMARPGASLTLTDAAIANRVLHTYLDEDGLGGWRMHAAHTGLADHVCDNEVMGLRAIRRTLHYDAKAPIARWPVTQPLGYRPALDTLVPEDASARYDVRELLRAISDTRAFHELGASWAENLVAGFARVAGRPVGLLASQNSHLAGTLDIQACRKALRHVRRCVRMGVPIVTFVDVPGFLPGHAQESGGLAGAVSELLHAWAHADVPRITIVIGKALGAAGIVLGSRASAPTRLAAWQGACPGLVSGARVPADPASGAPWIDAVLAPGATRQWLGEALAGLAPRGGRGH